MKALQKRTHIIYKYALLCLAYPMFSSCSEDELSPMSVDTESISFSIIVPEKADIMTNTRSTKGTNAVYESYKFNDSDMWVVSSEENGIDGEYVRQTPQTRGTVITNDNFYSSFGVYGYRFEHGGEWTVSEIPADAAIHINGEEVTPGGGVWNTAIPHMWPGAKFDMKFFAWAPLGIGEVSETGGKPQIAYIVPAEAENQKDLLIASDAVKTPADGDSPATYMETVPGDYHQPVNLHFYHAMTAVKVRAVGEMQGQVKSVTIRGVKGAGTHIFGERSWTVSGENRDFSQDIPGNITPDGDNGTLIIDGDATFMMMPQSLKETAELVVELKDGSVLTGSISKEGNKEWIMGTTVIYRISLTEIVEEPFFVVTPSEQTFSYMGGTDPYGVKSYIEQIKNGQKTYIPASWTVTGYSDDGGATWSETKPSWLTSFTTSGSGSAELGDDGDVQTVQYNSVVQEQNGVKTNTHNDRLKAAEAVNGIFDLSTKGGTAEMNTANCYIINAPGSYSLPLVYGNAIKDGQDNPRAYTYNGSLTKPADSYSTILHKFVNHLDNEITAPFIYDNADCVPYDAVLVWQDAPNLVTSTRLSEDKRNLLFDIPKESIKQGNAIVAVRDASGVILWSWHIFITDFIPCLEPTIEMSYNRDDRQRDKVVTNRNGVKYTYMGVNLGWCEDENTYYSPREIVVRFKQDKSGKEQTVIIRQKEQLIPGRYGTNVYYQYGRKDPMIAGVYAQNLSEGTFKDYYSELYTFNKLAPGKVSVGTSIQHPYINYDYKGLNALIEDQDKDWCVGRYTNLWSADNAVFTQNDNIVVKTIYDPSPVGYCVPAPMAFDFYSYNGKPMRPISYTNFNSPFTSADDFNFNYGVVLYCNPMTGLNQYDSSAGVIFLPFSGCQSLGVVGNVTIEGYYYAATPFLYKLTYGLLVGASQFGLSSNRARYNGYSVRPVREKN